MKINKIFLFAAVALMGTTVVSCGDDDDFEPGKPAGSNNVYFVDEADQALELTASSFTITVGRADGGSALSIPLKKVQVASVFTVPETVDFAAGETEKEVTIGMSSDAAPFTDYTLRLAIPEEYTNPYIQQDNVPELSIRVHKEDYKDYAEVVYYDDFWYEEAWDDVLQYSETLDLYRIAPWEAGYWIYLKIKKGESIAVCDNTGKEFTGANATGLDHPSYGAVYCTWDKTGGFSGYVADEDTYYILYKWTVAAGSFGSYYNTIKFK